MLFDKIIEIQVVRRQYLKKKARGETFSAAGDGVQPSQKSLHFAVWEMAKKLSSSMMGWRAKSDSFKWVAWFPCFLTTEKQILSLSAVILIRQ